jgi:hypothetical protein
MKLTRFFIASLLATALTAQAQQVWIEAESFTNPGGWVLDTQFIDVMGSPYLMAHGMGKPVKNAETEITIAEPGTYTVWVRTKNWVAPFDAEGAPGKFQLSVNGQPLEKVLGTEGKDWLWEKAGSAELKGRAKIALIDQTGFDGRVDAVLLTRDASFSPPNELAATNTLRRKLLGLPEKAPETKNYDLVVVGGGYSGMGAAISGARQGLSVAFIQNRPVLGGNGSSEVQVWAMGGTRRGLYPHLGEIVEEFADRASNSPAADPAEFNDKLKEEAVKGEKSMDLFLNTHVYGVEMAGATKNIRSVIGLDTKTGKETRFVGQFFVDCTGHGSVGGQISYFLNRFL